MDEEVTFGHGRSKLGLGSSLSALTRDSPSPAYVSCPLLHVKPAFGRRAQARRAHMPCRA